MYRTQIRLVTLFCFGFSMIFALASCTSSSKKPANQVSVEKVEKLQNTTEYSAVESEWNELYQ